MQMIKCDGCGKTEPAETTETFGEQISVQLGPRQVKFDLCSRACIEKILSNLALEWLSRYEELFGKPATKKRG